MKSTTAGAGMTIRGRMKQALVSTLGSWPDCHPLKMAVACGLWWMSRRWLKNS